MAAAAVTQLSIPGVLVLISKPDGGAPVADRAMWQRAVLQASLPSAAKLVALALCSHAAPTGSNATSTAVSAQGGHAVCAPGLTVLVSETGYSRTHVQRQLATLRKRGWLVAASRPASGRPARFGLTLPATVARTLGIRTESASQSDEGAASTSHQSDDQQPQEHQGHQDRQDRQVPDEQRGMPVPASGRARSTSTRQGARPAGTATAKALAVAGDPPAGAVPPVALRPVASTATAAFSTPPQPAFPPAPAQPTASTAPETVTPGAVTRPAAAPRSGPLLSAVPAAAPVPAPAAPTAVSAAASQVLATLARAMRCTTDDLGHAAERLTKILDEGAWSPAALAMHLVDFVMGGVAPSGGCPADSLGWRLDRLPRSAADCACRSCRSWQHRPDRQHRPATQPRPASQHRPNTKAAMASTRPVTGAGPVAMPAANPTPPELSAIERAAAAGAAQARLAAARATA